MATEKRSTSRRLSSATRRIVACLAVAAAVLVAPAPSAAQAWTPPRGELIVSTTYQFFDANKHILSDAVTGDTLTPLERAVGVDFQTKVVDDHYRTGRTSRQLVVVDFDLGLTDRLALMGRVIGGAGRYVGPLPEGPVDDSNWNSSMQDARIGARYVAVDTGAWVVTPFAAFQFPIVDYAVQGHASHGLGLNEFEVGADVGRILNLGGLPKLFVQGRYGYSFVENVDDIAIDRSHVSLQAGYFVGRATLQIGTDWRVTHGGLDPAADAYGFGAGGLDLGPTPRFTGFHDRTLAVRDWRLGGTISLAVTDTTAVFVGYNDLLWGENTDNAQVFTVGMDWNVRLFGLGLLGD